jgi:hypothetical protein
MDIKINIQPHGIALTNLEQLGNCLTRLAQETRRSYTSGQFDNAKKWLDAVNEKCCALQLPQLEIDFDFINRVRIKK